MSTEINLLDLDSMTPSQLFEKGWSIHQELSKSTTDETLPEFETQRQKAIEYLVKAQGLLNELHMFSMNESIDEISSNEIKYMLVDGLLGWLYSKIRSSKPNVRLASLENAKLNFTRYLKLTRDYELHNINLEAANQQQSEMRTTIANEAVLNGTTIGQAEFDANLIKMAHERTEKIRRYKEQKELEASLETMKTAFEDSSRLDDEDRRQFFLKLVKYWINKSIDEFKSVIDEIEILKQLVGSDWESKKTEMNKNLEEKRKAAPPSKPYILTKDVLQAQVFGAGYPSVPVYSIDEFYDQLADKGMMPKSNDPNENYAPVKIGGGVTESQKEKEKAEKDLLEDANDEDELRRQREWDEFKDENKRGAGNRFNRS